MFLLFFYVFLSKPTYRDFYKLLSTFKVPTMSYLKNILSIFKWGRKEEKNQQELPTKKGINPTAYDLKSWVEKELPPLAWERITLRTSKYLLQRYQKTLKEFELDEFLPQDVQERVQFLILEMYQKEIKFENTGSITINA